MGKFFRKATGFGLCLAFVLSAQAQSRVEPGLEEAVNWKWRVAPSEPGQWIAPLPDPTPVPESAAPATPVLVAEPVYYEVKRGDALAIIARKFGLFPVHLKTFNGLTSDLIRIGDVLKIPTKEEARAIAPLPEPPKKAASKKKKPGEEPGVTDEMLETAALQAFLDRRQFSGGPIDGLRGPAFEKVLHMFVLTYPDAADPVKLGSAVQNEVGNGLTRYALREADFRFIAPPKAERMPPSNLPPNAKAPASSPGPSYQDLSSAPQLLYRTPWEFVAERFHCDEAFLKKLNAHLLAAPTPGTELRVPNVIPFEIEKGFRGMIQPPPGNGMTKAAILDLSLLQIFEKDTLIAVMPISMARPGLRGKGSWTILNAIPLPRMGTFQERREETVKPKPLFGQPEPEQPSTKPAKLPTEQFLAPGPNNPAGVIWIDLAKAGTTEALPYGLHGTSVPDHMQTHYGIGGIQMANWNIVRAARLLPPGTDLEWKQGGLVAPAAPAAPAAAPLP